MLENIRTSLNAALPPLVIPNTALTLGGFINPANTRLFSATVDDAGLGLQDYIGILSDVTE